MDLLKKRKTDENGSGVYTTTDIAAAPPLPNILTRDDADRILDPFTKEQLLPILRTALLRYPDVLEAVRSVADADVSQRKLFVRGLGWETTTEKLRSIFSVHGELDEAIVITDKATGKSKGYGFVTFKHIDGAVLALREPNKKIDGRITVTQLAAAGVSSGSNAVDVSLRKIYVGNVPFEISSERLLIHFSAYGEIEEGPLGFDKQTGKAKGFAFFVYKTEEGARASLVDPIKNIDGHQVHCKLATDGKKGKPGVPNAGGIPGPTGAPGDVSGGDRFGVPTMPGSMNTNYGGYGGFSGGPQPGMPYQNPHLNSSLPSSIGFQGGQSFGNQGPGSFGNVGGYGAGAVSHGSGAGGSQYTGSGTGEYGGLNSAGGSSMYRMPPASVGMPGAGGYPDGGNYALSSSAYPTQMHQPSTGPRVPPGGGMYQGMPPYY